MPLAAYAVASQSFSCGDLAAVRHKPRSDLVGGAALGLSKLAHDPADIVEGLGRCSSHARSHRRSEAATKPVAAHTERAPRAA